MTTMGTTPARDDAPMTAAAYKALRDAHSSLRVEVARAIETSGRDGWNTLRALESAQAASLSAWSELGHEDRMAVILEEQATLDALLAKSPLAAPEGQ